MNFKEELERRKKQAQKGGDGAAFGAFSGPTDTATLSKVIFYLN